ncbi:hypothetical protein C1646_776300 [Rhizophagus diaphanus]|nr:hypothetical protein C1646_776300 [Rhizophagus diaphanus] [Rhizophagus sp. MUCL 43196]
MADIYDALEEIKNKHEIEKYIESREKYQTDPSCLKCYRINKGEEPEMFKKFWKVFQKKERRRDTVYPSNMRFTKFEEWLEEIGIVAEVKNRGYNTMKYFKEILHMEENIAEEENREKVKKIQKSITYKWWNNKYRKIWESNEITNMIIAKIIEEKGFIEEYSDVKELIKHEIMKTKDFMEYYITIKELDNEEIIKELKKWYNTNIIKCPLCQKIILIKETMNYNKEFEGRICKSCFEKEENDAEIETEKRL